MPITIEERVMNLEVSVASMKGQLGADLKHVDKRFDELGKSIEKLSDSLEETNKSLSGLTANAAASDQKSTMNEKVIYAVIGTIISSVTFVLGKLL